MTMYRFSPRTRSLPFFITLLIPTIAAAQSSSSGISIEAILKALEAGERSTVCEIGAGDGDQTIAAARIVGPEGRIYSSELGESRVKTLQDNVARSSLAQITVVAGDPVKTNFPDAGCDAVFMRNVYHHFGDPAAMNASIAAALKPGGRVAVIDFTPPKEAPRATDRGKDGMHGVLPDSVTREMKEAGFEPVATESGAQRWFMVVVTKPKSS
jgi:ubiquinone/menaquinone biosynthesis C-methylase UbiE